MEKLNRAQTIMLALTMHGNDHNTMYTGKHYITIDAYCECTDECETIETIVSEYTKGDDKVTRYHLENENQSFYYIEVSIHLGDRFEK